VIRSGRAVHPGVWVAVALVAAAGCRRGFEVRDFANPEALFRGAMQEFERGKLANAIAGFERLSLDLSTRDALLIPTYYYLGLAHERQKEFLLAAQAYARLTDAFPSDTLAAYAMLGEGRAYHRLWPRADLDAEYGLKAVGTLRVLLTSYPEAPVIPEATARIAEIEDQLARKDYQNGLHYLKTRKSYDSAIIYFKDVVETYPSTPTARLAWLGMLEAYRRRKWTEEANETCDELRRRYPSDAEVREACGVGPGADSLATLPAPPPA
jgi:outer membrane protein assembly factor BamD